MLTGLLQCERCGGTLEVRSRAHGRTRRHFYECSTHRRRGRRVCSGIAVPLRSLEEKILDAFEATILEPQFLQKVFARVLASGGDTVSNVDHLQHRAAEIKIEISRLTNAIAGGMDSPAVREALRAREAEGGRIAEHLAHAERVDAAQRQPEVVRDRFEAMLGDWRGLLRKHPAQARSLIRKLLQSRLSVQAEERAGVAGFSVRGGVDVDPLITVVLKGDASGAGVTALYRPKSDDFANGGVPKWM